MSVGPNTKTEWGGWAKAVLMQEGDLPTVADCCRLAALLEDATTTVLAAERAKVVEAEEVLRVVRSQREIAEQDWQRAEKRAEKAEREIAEMRAFAERAEGAVAQRERDAATERKWSLWDCRECGDGVRVDEDGCCSTCGRDCDEHEHLVLIFPAPPPREDR